MVLVRQPQISLSHHLLTGHSEQRHPDDGGGGGAAAAAKENTAAPRRCPRRSAVGLDPKKWESEPLRNFFPSKELIKFYNSLTKIAKSESNLYHRIDLAHVSADDLWLRNQDAAAIRAT